MKSYTDLPQSKVLTEILPIESADMSWVSNGLGKPFARTIPINGDPEELCACWSLAALLDILPADKIITMGITIEDNKKIFSVGYMDKQRMYQAEKENMVDACYEIILKLKENKLI